MKRVFFGFLAVAGLVLAACDKAPETGAVSPGVTTTKRPSSDTPEITMEKDRFIQGMQPKLEEIRTALEKDPTNQVLVKGNQDFTNLLARIEGYPASSVKDLHEFVMKETAVGLKGSLEQLSMQFEDKFPRTVPNAAPGETRPISNPDGTCSEDFKSDMGGLMRLSVAFIRKAAERLTDGGPSSEVRMLGQSLNQHCEEMMERYPDDGRCTLQEDGNTREIGMSEIGESCGKMGEAIASLRN